MIFYCAIRKLMDPLAQRKCARVSGPNPPHADTGAIRTGDEYGASMLDYYVTSSA